MFEEIPRSQSILTGNTERGGKGILTLDNVVMAYSEMLVVAHEFAALLQFGASFEIMEFLATQQVKVSQCMAEEHALTQTTKSNDEDPLAKLG